MPKTREQKELALKDLEYAFDHAKAVAMSSFSGISIKEDQELRKSLRDKEVGYQVIKKTLLRRALESKGWSDVDISSAKGNIAIAISSSDEVAPAKELHIFAKKYEDYELLAGIIVEDERIDILDEAGVNALALAPGREELIAKVVGSIGSPLSGLVGVLQGNLRNFVYTLKAISEQK